MHLVYKSNKKDLIQFIHLTHSFHYEIKWGFINTVLTGTFANGKFKINSQIRATQLYKACPSLSQHVLSSRACNKKWRKWKFVLNQLHKRVHK